MRSRALVLVVHDRDLDLRLLRVGPLRRCYLCIGKVARRDLWGERRACFD